MFNRNASAVGSAVLAVACMGLWATVAKSLAQTPVTAEVAGEVAAVAIEEYAAPEGSLSSIRNDPLVQPVAGTGGEGACADAPCCGDGSCGCCREVCCVTREEVEVDKYCWNVGCEKVCVPGITFPWEGCGWSFFGHKQGSSCCGPCTGACTCGQAYKPARPGSVVCIRTLEKEDYACKACQCKWELRTVCTGAGCSGCRDPNFGARVSGASPTRARPVINKETEILTVAAIEPAHQRQSAVAETEIAVAAETEVPRPWWRRLPLLRK